MSLTVRSVWLSSLAPSLSGVGQYPCLPPSPTRSSADRRPIHRRNSRSAQTHCQTRVTLFVSHRWRMARPGRKHKVASTLLSRRPRSFFAPLPACHSSRGPSTKAQNSDGTILHHSRIAATLLRSAVGESGPAQSGSILLLLLSFFRSPSTDRPIHLLPSDSSKQFSLSLSVLCLLEETFNDVDILRLPSAKETVASCCMRPIYYALGARLWVAALYGRPQRENRPTKTRTPALAADRDKRPTLFCYCGRHLCVYVCVADEANCNCGACCSPGLAGRRQGRAIVRTLCTAAR